ncbi:MAG: SDR family oxidoreductase [Gluconacetobacter diazotrophicus]|nr:SDR family oxidoreductase [Gluconacetobacter diazotrophicus]
MSDTRPGMQDPRTQYPQPPFPAQLQSNPGLSRDMTPQPDHGETSYRGSGRLRGRKALITGADSGIGRAVAIAFAREGADVAISHLPEEAPDAEQTLAVLRETGVTVVDLPGDVRDEAFCIRLVEEARHALGGLDILVNNAGTLSSAAHLTDITTEAFDNTLKTNLYALFWITRAAIPLLPPGAAIINTSSIEASKPSRHIVDYSLTKAAISNFTKSMAPQLLDRGIRINAVAPGPIWTVMQPAGQPPEMVPEFGAQLGYGRPGQPAELAPAYVLLASQEASFVTGEVYGVTGGMIVA